MKVTVKDKYLNVRSGKPLLSAPSYQYIAPGSEIEVDGTLYPGDPFENNKLWLKDGANNYYWSGGVSGLPGAHVSFGWFDRLNIAGVWEKGGTKGAGATVAVLDSGYALSNPDLSGKIKPSETNIIIDASKYPGRALIIGDESPDCHGSRCASLIGAMNSRDWLIGIAPDCELLIAKTSVGSELLDNNYLLRGIRWALDQNADVISVSYAIDLTPAQAQGMEQQIAAMLGDRQVLLLAAAGNTDGTPQRADYYPACLPSFVSVGASTALGALSPITALNDVTVIHAPGEAVESFGPGNLPTPDDGTSFSAPIVAGVAALAVAYLKQKNGRWDKAALLQHLYNSGDPVPGSPSKKVINPIQLFQNL